MKISKCMGMSTMYNFRSDLDLDIGRVVVRRILYVSDSWLLQLYTI